jgi:hypothetical protein
MARTATHPGEHLADELKALGNERGGVVARHQRPGQPDHWYHQRHACDHRRHRDPARPLVRHQRRFLAQPAEALRAAPGACRRRRRCGKAALARGVLAREEHAPRRGCAFARSTAHHRGLNQENARNRLSGQGTRHESSTEPSAQASQAGNSKATMSMEDVVILREGVARSGQVARPQEHPAHSALHPSGRPW